MPKIYRAMKRAADGLPTVGNRSKELGVREPPDAHADVDVDPQNRIVLNGRGMSVAENWRHLLPHLIPKRLQAGGLCDDASGSNSLACFTTGAGAFISGPINASLALALKPNDPYAGNVVPTTVVPLAQFQSDLSATRDQWRIDET
jgi:hypothetical protein